MGKDKKPQKKVVVIGGGIGGLTVAHELSERGFHVVIYEASPILGGKAACEPYNENLLRDHSIKNFSSYYYCMMESMKRIPFEEELVEEGFVEGGKKEVLEAREARKKERQEEGTEMQEVDPKRKKKETKPAKKKKVSTFNNLVSLPILDCVMPDGSIFPINTSLNLSLMSKFGEFKKLRAVLKKYGLEGEKVDAYLWKHVRLLWMCEERKLNELNTISYEQYLGFEPKSHPELGLLMGLVEIIAAAKVDGSALAAADQTLKMFGRFFNPHNLTNTGNLLNGTIQHKLIEPWAKHVQNLGGEIYTKKPAAKIMVDVDDKDKICGVELADGTVVTGDYYVCALPYSRLKFVVNQSNLADRFKQVPFLNNENGEKWGHNCHFALSKMPETGKHKMVSAVLNSKWSCIYYYVSDQLWTGEKYPSKAAPVQLWITCSDATAKGELYNKSYPECTEEEFKNELLHQIHFKDEDKALIVDSVIGRGLGFWNEKEQKMTPGLPPIRDPEVAVFDEFNQGPPIHGERFVEHPDGVKLVCEAPLYAREIGSPEFPTETAFKNLFLAGECVKTKQMISTMEKANEGGKRCAAAICKLEKKNYPTKKYEYHPLPLRFLRMIDGFFYNHLCCCCHKNAQDS